MNSYKGALLASIPLILALALSVLQFIPLPYNVVAKLSPRVPELNHALTPPNIGYDTIHSLPTSVEIDEDFSSDHDGENDTEGDRALEMIERLEQVKDRLSESEALKQTRILGEQAFPYEDDSAYDVETAMIIDALVENEFLPEAQRNRVAVWGHTISLYPLASREMFMRMWAGFILFLAASLLFNTNASRRFLFIVAALVGLCYSLLCLSLRANSGLLNLKIFDYWLLSKAKIAGYGTFVDRNAAGGYLVLTLGACVYLASIEFLGTVFRLQREVKERKKEEKEARESGYDKPIHSKWKVLLGDFFYLFNRRFILWLFVMGVIVAAIFASYSRGASCTAVLVFLLGTLLLCLRKEARKYWLAFLLVALIAGGAIVAVNLHEHVDARMATIVETDDNGDAFIQANGRFDNWRGALHTSRDYLWFGAGLNAYPVANYANDVATKQNRYYHMAENVFIQTLVEFGIIGLTLLTTEYLLLFWLIGKFCFGNHSLETYAFASAGVVIVVGQLVAANFDFGNYFPANLMLFAALIGASLGRQNRRRWDMLKQALSNRKLRSNANEQMRRLALMERVGAIVTTLILLVTLLGTHWVLQESDDLITRENLLSDSVFAEDELPYAKTTDVEKRIKAFQKYVSKRDDSFEVRYTLGELETLRFRLHRRDEMLARRPDTDPKLLWAQTTLDSSLEILLKYQGIGFEVPSLRIRGNELIQSVAPELMKNFLAARRICPMKPMIYPKINGVAPLATMLRWPDNRNLIELNARRSASLAPYSSQLLYINGYYLSNVKSTSLQNQFWQKTVEYDPRQAESVAIALAAQTPQNKVVDAIVDVMPNNPYVLCRLIRQYAQWKQTTLYRGILAKGEEVFSVQPQDAQDAKYCFYAGNYFKALEEFDRADDFYARAYELEPDVSDFFFARIRMMCQNSKVMNKDQECYDLLMAYKNSGAKKNLWLCDKYLEDVEKNLKRSQARSEALLRIQREREQDERIRNRVYGEKESDQAPSSDNADDLQEENDEL
ncbi:MAG: O-antigen ligase family protein [Planctomycetia bacterium]|nr:O-antigen ligase family protein [Planctomycetia bacterium]